MSKTSRLILFVLFLLVHSSLVLAADSASLQVLRITPTGEDVPAARQIVIKFDRPVVPIGRMEREPDEIPIQIRPELECEWRWLNTSSLACQLGEKTKLVPSTRYSVVLGIGPSADTFRARDGSKLSESITHSFITQRPKVTRYWFHKWKSPGWPGILVTFDQKVALDSVQEKLSFRDAQGREYPLQVSEVEYNKGMRWSIEPVEELPLDTAITLSIAPGVQALVGDEPGIEQRAIVTFDTFGEFRFLGVKCGYQDSQLSLISVDLPLAKQPRCNPMESVQLIFSAPLAKEEVKKGMSIEPDLAGGREDYDPWQYIYSHWSQSQPHKAGAHYPVHIPLILKAFDTYTLRAEAASIKDTFGRELADSVDFAFQTAHRPPKFHFGGPLSVLEKEVDTHVPIYITNLEDITLDYRTLTGKNIQRAGKERYELSKAQDIAYAYPLKMRELLGGESGVVFGRFSTKPTTGYSPNWYFNQVTPFHVHFKFGHFDSLVWVTRLATGEPVEGAKVELVVDSLNRLRTARDVRAKGTTNAVGQVSLEGTSVLDPSLELLNEWDAFDPRFFVRVEKDGDIAYLPVHYDFKAQPYGTWSYSAKRFGHIRTWGTTAQGVYRAGDTIQYKIYVRNQDTYRYSEAPKSTYSLQIIDPMGKVAATVNDIELNEFGALDGEFRVLPTAAVGWYRFELKADFTKHSWQPLRVLVSDFTPSPFRVTSEIEGELFTADEEITVQTAAKLHAGGPFVDAGMRVTARLQQRVFSSTDPIASRFSFQGSEYHYSAPKTVHSVQERLDSRGEFETSFRISPEQSVEYGSLFVESAVRDDRGKYVAASSKATFYGRDRFVGMRQENWVVEKGKPTKVELIVVDEEGKPVAGTDIKVQVLREQVKASRVKGAGNAYLTKYVTEWVTEKECEVESEKAAVSCPFTPQGIGHYRIVSEIEDTDGRKSSSDLYRWGIGDGRTLWQSGSEHKLDIIPEQSEYKIGDTARFLIKNPYPGAKALFTIERYGILKSWTATLAGSTEIVEFPIEKDHLPGVYFSAVVMSPRVDTPLSETGVDLGKPTYRLGYVRMSVIDPYKQLEVRVVSDRQTYKPREKVQVDLQVQTAQGANVRSELAVAVLDEAVFDLIQGGANYFDPYKGFYTLETLDVANFNILKQLVGQRKFETKGANPGGGGGGADVEARNLFKFVSYWNPSISLDEQGKASISFEAPDNLTGWRVLALAVTPTDLMGLGQGTFKVNKPTEIRPALPNQVVEGDTFTARFTVMNRTKEERELKVTLKVSGQVGETDVVSTTIDAQPYKRTVVRIPVATNGDGSVLLDVQAGDEIDTDRVRVEVPVNKKKALEAAANYGTTTEATAKEVIAFPKDMRTDVGRVSFVASPTVLGALEGAFEYLKGYPYICWEQKLTKGVAAAQYVGLQHYLSKSFLWPKAADIPQVTLNQAASHQAPNGGMTYFLAKNEYVSPYLSAYTAIAFNWLAEAGYQIPTEVEKRLHDYLLLFLRKNVQPDFYSESMATTVRAVALAALAKHKKITKSDIARYRPHIAQLSLFGRSYFLQAVLETGGERELEKQILDSILAQANETGGKYIFSETLDTRFQRILASPLRSNCAVLDSVLLYRRIRKPGAYLEDLPFKSVRAITQSRKRRDRWENTQENIFCMNALVEYSKSYEQVKPNMSFTVELDKSKLGTAAFKDFRSEAIEFDRRITEKDPGREVELTIDKTGQGRLYYATRLFYSPKELKQRRINSGIEIRREYSVEREGEWEQLENPNEVRQGELVRVDLFISLPAARNFVVVDDAVPGGLEPVNTQLATASTVDAEKGSFTFAKTSFWYERNDWLSYGWSRWSFYHQELRHDSVRFYSDYLPPGNYHLSYVAQAIAPGEFTILPAHVEEMYDPDVFGKGLPGELQVEELE